MGSHFRHQQLIDFIIVDVDDFEFVATMNHKVCALGNFAESVHHKASDGFVGFGIGEIIDVEDPHHIG